MVTTAQPSPFYPASARYFCAHCGFPFRDPNRIQLYCHEYPLPGHGRCGRRLRDAQETAGLEKRLRKTQETDPYARRTTEDAIAHEWVRQHFPHVDLKQWQPASEQTERSGSGSAQTSLADPALSFLLTWHPREYLWEEHGYYEAIHGTADGQLVPDSWTVGNRKGGISPGDRAYLYRYHDSRGIVASGVITSGVQTRPHWDGSGRPANYADVSWDIVLDYEDRLPLEVLTAEVPEMKWNHLQGSGIAVKDAAAQRLAGLWQRHIGDIIFRSPDETPTNQTLAFPEGAVSQIEVNRYERDPRARRACLQHWGYRCTVCDLSFEEIYGPLGQDYIHVHHVHELSRLPPGYVVNPVTDLRPVCPNCHAMIHRGPGPALTVDQLRQQLHQPRA